MRGDHLLTMTLCVAIVTPRIAVHVSDRRVTWKLSNKIEKADDDRNKAIIWNSGDFRIVISYCGLAELDGKPTDIKIAEVLASLANPRTLGELLYEFPKFLSHAYVETKKVYRGDAPLEVTWSGFSVGLAFQAVFSNLLDESGKPVSPNERFFHSYKIPPDFPMERKGKDRCYRIAASGDGATLFVPHFMRTLVYCGKRGGFKPSKADSLVRKLVSMIRQVATHPNSASSVGGNCMSCIISPHSEVEPSCRYHPIGEDSVIYTPIFLSGPTHVSFQLTKRD